MRYLILVLVILLAGCIVYPGDEAILKSMGYNVDDVSVFLGSIGRDSQDFLKSPSLRKQYDKFNNGETSNFINQAQNKHDKESSQSTGLATGIAVGMAMNSGRK
jgi:hypothetical protein